MASSFNRRYLPEIDHLRGFAAILVLLYHGLHLVHLQMAYGVGFDPVQHWMFNVNPALAILVEGHTGVALFMVLSGFILSIGAVDHTFNYKAFLITRMLRIYPMLIVALMVAAHVRPTPLASFLTTLLPVNMSGGVITHFTTNLWAVALEFQCSATRRSSAGSTSFASA